MTYEEFFSKYIDHIEGRVEPDHKNENRPTTAEGAESNNDQKQILSPKTDKGDHKIPTENNTEQQEEG